MKEINCESVLMAHMASSDGEGQNLSREHLAHVESCINCQQELKQMKFVNEMIGSHTLIKPEVKLWTSISKRIGRGTRPLSNRRPYALIGLLLVTYKFLEMLPERDLGLVFKVVPLAIVFSLFLLIKENPFRINSDLTLER